MYTAKILRTWIQVSNRISPPKTKIDSIIRDSTWISEFARLEHPSFACARKFVRVQCRLYMVHCTNLCACESAAQSNSAYHHTEYHTHSECVHQPYYHTIFVPCTIAMMSNSTTPEAVAHQPFDDDTSSITAGHSGIPSSGSNVDATGDRTSMQQPIRQHCLCFQLALSMTMNLFFRLNRNRGHPIQRMHFAHPRTLIL